MNILSSNTFEVPSQLDAILDKHMEQPAAAGDLTNRQLEKIWCAVERLYRTGNHPLISFCLRRHGQIVLNRSLGYLKLGDNNALPSETAIAKTSTPICLYSASKLVTAMLIHGLNEEGRLNLLDPISCYLPEYAQKGKRYATIFHLLSHRGGIPKIEGEVNPEILFNKNEVLERLYQSKPISTSGSRLAYHALTAGYILGEIIERVTGQKLTDYMQQRFAQPMQMRCFNYGVADPFLSEVAMNYATGFYPKIGTDHYLKHVLGADLQSAVTITNDPRFMQTISPAANIYTSAEEICRFFEMLLNGGTYQGQQILRPETVFRATIPTSGITWDRSLLIPMRYSLGAMLGANPVGLYGPMTAQAFGHLGFSNNLCWADPERDISVALLTTGKSIVGTHLPALAHLLYQISTQCPRLEVKQRRAVFARDYRREEVI